ncbi:hypothetical protein [Roseovarius sp. 2305UL8-3]|uniref:hypothetical protein n=1 Tax=Roseovarius conchicola TaxID=3121636 RepID=UPI0035283ADD
MEETFDFLAKLWFLRGMQDSQSAKFSSDLIWCLRALAQNAAVQKELYPPFVLVADELILDFHDQFLTCTQAFLDQHPQITALDALIDSKGGIPEFWTDEALERSQFWSEIRELARSILVKHDLSTFAPHPSTGTYVAAKTPDDSGL